MNNMDMKEFSKNSWHYRLAEQIGIKEKLENTNHISICEYISYVIGGLILSIFVIMVLAFLVFLAGDTIRWLFTMVYEGQLRDPDSFGSLCGMLFYSVLIVSYALDVSVKYITTLTPSVPKHIPEPKEDGMLKLMYKSFKDKYCFLISFK